MYKSFEILFSTKPISIEKKLSGNPFYLRGIEIIRQAIG